MITTFRGLMLRFATARMKCSSLRTLLFTWLFARKATGQTTSTLRSSRTPFAWVELIGFMASLFGRLFRYRDRPGRAPLEDYLSEFLPQFFNTLPHYGNLPSSLQLLLPTAYQP